MKDIYLTAIEPPGNIQRPYYRIQQALFRDFGVISARALPPLIPLSFQQYSYSAEKKKSALQELNYRIEGSFYAESSIQFHNSMLYVPVPGMNEFREKIGINSSSESGIIDGILLAAVYDPSLPIDRILAEYTPAAQSWRRASLISMRIQYEDTGENFLWEIEETVKLVCLS